MRKLRADEIECRVNTINANGCSLLLYKDARVDMRILDSTFGSMNWQRKHEVIDGNLYCTVSVWDAEKEQWISKQDVGTESYTEKEKGQSSDSFKRACFNFGIGRELYSSPFIWINKNDVELVERNGKFTTYDHFTVKDIGYQGEMISRLEIANDKKDRIVYTFNKLGAQKYIPEFTPTEADKLKPATSDQIEQLEKICEENGVTTSDIARFYQLSDATEMNRVQVYTAIKNFEKFIERLQDNE